MNTTTTVAPEVLRPSHGSGLPVPNSLTFVGIDVVLFSLMGYLAYRQFRKARSDLRAPSGEAAPVSAAGGETRLIFMGMLALSNISRAITLCIECFTQQDKQLQKSVRTWVRDFLMSLPTLFFLSTYSVVVRCWAQVYYASVLVSFPLLKPIVVFINIAVYVVFAVIACLTLLLMAWSEFRQYLYFLIGILFLFCGVNFFYYGVKVAAQLSERNKQLSRKSRIIRRVIVLTSSVPLILLIRGIYCTGVGLGFITSFAPWGLSRLSWDCLNFFMTEFFPSVLMLSVFWPGAPRADAYEPPSSLLSSREDTVNSLQSPLLRDTPMSEPRPGEIQHPHLREAQSKLESLSAQARLLGSPVVRRGASVESHGDISPDERLINRPWSVRKPAKVV